MSRNHDADPNPDKRGTLMANDVFLIARAARNSTTIVTQSRIGLGSVIAIVCSWERNRSILWAFNRFLGHEYYNRTRTRGEQRPSIGEYY
jgi:hypothetical protein